MSFWSSLPALWCFTIQTTLHHLQTCSFISPGFLTLVRAKVAVLMLRTKRTAATFILPSVFSSQLFHRFLAGPRWKNSKAEPLWQGCCYTSIKLIHSQLCMWPRWCYAESLLGFSSPRVGCATLLLSRRTSSNERDQQQLVQYENTESCPQEHSETTVLYKCQTDTGIFPISTKKALKRMQELKSEYVQSTSEKPFWCSLQGWSKFWQYKELPDFNHCSLSCVSCLSLCEMEH